MRRIYRFLPHLPLWWLRYTLGFRAKSTREAYAALVFHTRNEPRYTPGTFIFPFGRMRYADPLSFSYQFLEIFLDRTYDFETEAEDPVILDCGANAGLATVRFLQLHPTARVRAYEADPAITGILRENLQTLGLSRVQSFDAAVSDRTGTAKFCGDGADGGHLTQNGSTTVATVRLADEIQKPVDLLKLDVEGAEYAVIHDLSTSGKLGSVRRLVCEFHVGPGEETRVLAALQQLQDSGFRFVIADARSGDYLRQSAIRTPFPRFDNARYLFIVYAWKANG